MGVCFARRDPFFIPLPTRPELQVLYSPLAINPFIHSLFHLKKYLLYILYCFYASHYGEQNLTLSLFTQGFHFSRRGGGVDIDLKNEANPVPQVVMQCNLEKSSRCCEKCTRRCWADLANQEGSVLVSQDCCNKWPQTGWLNTTEISSLAVLEARNVKSRCQRGRFFLEALKRLAASGGCC